MTSIKTIGILTGGGDCPGLNAAIRGIGKAALFRGINVIGIRDGYQGLIETNAIAGCCSFYKPEALKITGLEDEDFIFGPEDAELSFRLKKIGKLIVNLNAITFHKIATSIKVSGWRYRSFNETKGFLLLIKKIGSPSDKLVGYLYHLLRIPYFFILLIFKKRNKDKVIGFTLGCFNFFFNKK